MSTSERFVNDIHGYSRGRDLITARNIQKWCSMDHRNHITSLWCWISCPRCFIRTKEQKINVRDCGELSFDYLMSEDSTGTEPYCFACFIRYSPAMSQGLFNCCVARSLNHQCCSTRKTVLNECLEGESGKDLASWKLDIGNDDCMGSFWLSFIPHVSSVDEVLFLYLCLMWYSQQLHLD